MNRQAPLSMLLSVLIVCACAVALRPVEPATSSAADVADAPAIEPPPVLPRSEPEPEPEPKPKPEPEPTVAQEVPSSDKTDEPAPIATEREEFEDPPPPPAPDLDFAPSPVAEPADDEPAEAESPAPPGPFVGPPREADFIAPAPIIDAPDIVEPETTEETPAPRAPEPVAPPAPEPAVKPPPKAGAITIPRSRSGFFFGDEGGATSRSATGDRSSRGGSEPSRSVKPARPAARFWTPSR